MNQQLISYYFGGKQGLLDELRRQWAASEATLVPSDASFTDTVAAYLDATLDRPERARLMIWQALGDEPGITDEATAERRARLREAVERMRRRQAQGEITGDLDAEFVLLLAYAVTFAPVAMPNIVQGIFGVDPYSSEYRRRCIDQLAKIVRPAAGPEQAAGPKAVAPKAVVPK